jgi:hypothetical protein
MFEGMDIQITTVRDPRLDKITPVGPRVLEVDPFEPAFDLLGPN